jgi:protein-L-isoaspartate(D-aspartate) O-methyltransferase
MTNFSVARENMVESQVRPNGITDRRIIDAMIAVAREDFVPESRRGLAYMDEDVELASAPSRYLIEAMTFARLVQLAEVKPGSKVLLVGAGTGYGAAVVSRLAARVVALEDDSRLAAVARKALAGLSNVMVVERPLAAGCAAEGPFDAVIFEGRVGEVPEALFAQVKDGGFVVAVVGEEDVAKIHVWRLAGKTPALRLSHDATIAALPGFARQRPAFVF